MADLKKRLRKRLMKNTTVKYLRRVYWSVWTELYAKHADEYTSIVKAYKKTVGIKPNIICPLRYTEKLQWLKLFYRDNLIERVSDKYEMKNYLREQGYPELAVEVIDIYDSTAEIDFDKLPKQFVMKATHGSGWNLVCSNKDQINWRQWKRLFDIWLTQNPYWLGREWNYREMKPKILVEKYLEDDSGGLRDYKIYCFSGKPAYLQVDENRNTPNHKRSYYDREGKSVNMTDGQKHASVSSIKFGESQRLMFDIAEKLSAPFPHVRIDFYEVKGNLYIGEFTFFDGSGYMKYKPDEIDFHWGEMIELPKPNYNLELYDRLLQQQSERQIRK